MKEGSLLGRVQVAKFHERGVQREGAVQLEARSVRFS